LADDGFEDPGLALSVALKREGIAQKQFVVLEEGVAKDF
jgi:hypothetical protein